MDLRSKVVDYFKGVFRHFYNVIAFIGAVASIVAPGLLWNSVNQKVLCGVMIVVMACGVGYLIFSLLYIPLHHKIHLVLKYGASITLYKSDYTKSMKKLAKKRRLICVIGVNDRFEMINIGPTGVHRAVRDTFFSPDEYKIFTENVKEYVEQKLGKKYGKQMAAYTCVRAPIKSSKYKNKDSQALMVVNSKLTEPGKLIHGYKVEKVVGHVFDELVELDWETVLFPVISGANVGNRDKAQYLNTIELIVREFLKLRESRNGKHLVIALNPETIRENDYEFSEIGSLIELLCRNDKRYGIIH